MIRLKTKYDAYIIHVKMLTYNENKGEMVSLHTSLISMVSDLNARNPNTCMVLQHILM